MEWMEGLPSPNCLRALSVRVANPEPFSSMLIAYLFEKFPTLEVIEAAGEGYIRSDRPDFDQIPLKDAWRVIEEIAQESGIPNPKMSLALDPDYDPLCRYMLLLALCREANDLGESLQLSGITKF